MSTDPKPVKIPLDAQGRVSGLLQKPPAARACYVMAHGAGAGMTHPLMTSIANDLALRGIATLRYHFPYMERGEKRLDPSKVARATVRAAVAEAARLAPGLALFAGGRSYGGRMTSQAQAASPLPGVCGIVFHAFPLHRAGKPSAERGAHLADVHVPMLFLQGAHDELANLALLEPLVEQLGARATLRVSADADHSFHVPARSGRKDSEVLNEMADSLVDWISATMPRTARS